MDPITISSIVIVAVQDIGEVLVLGLPAVLLVMASTIGLGMLIAFIAHEFAGSEGPGTTSVFGGHHSWYDRVTYKPWKGYNRLRSKKWNLEHMPD